MLNEDSPHTRSYMLIRAKSVLEFMTKIFALTRCKSVEKVTLVIKMS